MTSMSALRMKAKFQRLVRKGGEGEDSTTVQLANLAQLLKENETHFDQIIRLGQKHLRSSRSACEDLHGLADHYRCYADSGMGDDDDDESIAPLALRLTSDFIHVSQHRKSDALREFESTVLVPLRKFLKGDMLAAKDQKKKHSRLRDKLEVARADLETAKATKKTTQEKKKEMEDACAELQAQFDESKYEAHSVFLNCAKMNELVVAQSMIDSFDSFYSFHSSCVQWLEQKKPEIDKLKERLKSNREASEIKRLVRATQTPAAQKILLEKNALFGTSLNTTLLREKERGIDCEVPLHVRKMGEWVIAFGLKEEGIFRVSGNQNHVNEWKDKINRGEPVDLMLDPKGEPHLICSLLKLYIRELPEPLCTVPLYDAFLDFARIEKSKKETNALKAILMKLPRSNYYLFREIIELCHQVIAFKGHNKMSATNMGTVWAPNLFHKTVKGSSNPADMMVSCSFDDMTLTSDLFVFMTENSKYLFDENPQLEPPPPQKKSLIAAVRDQEVDLIRELLEVDKIDPNIVDSETGESALNVLVALERPSADCIQMLVDAGADIDMLGADGLPPVFRVVTPQASPERKAALLCLIELGANTSKSHSVDGSPTTLLALVLAVDPSFSAEVQRALSKEESTDLDSSTDQPIVAKSLPSANTQPIQRGLPPKARSGSSASLHNSPGSPLAQRPMSQMQSGQTSPPLSPFPSPPSITLTATRSAPPNFVPSPHQSPIPPPLMGSPQLKNPTSPPSPKLSSPSLSPSSPSLPPPQISPEESLKLTPEPTFSVQPVYRRIALDPLVEALGAVVLAGCHTEFQQDAVEQTNASLAQIAQPLKHLFSNSESSIRSFSGAFSEGSKQAITRAGQDLQESAKKMIQSARQVYSNQSDVSQAAFTRELNKFVGSIRQLFMACDKAGFDVILGEAQSLMKCLSESLSYVRVGNDPQSFKDVSSPATFCVLRFNHLVKTLALQVPDQQIQFGLSQSCASIASCTADLSRESLTLMTMQAKFRNLAPVGTKAKAIISELQSINSVIHAPLPEKYLVPPSGDVLKDLQTQGEIEIERACLVLARAGEEEVFRSAGETLPMLFASLFLDLQGDRRKLMENTLAFVKITKSVANRAQEIASNGGREQKIAVFFHALEHLFRLSLVSVASYCVAPFGEEGADPFPVPSLPYVMRQISTCFLQLLVTVFPNE